MKKFLIDQALFLILGIAIMISIPYFCGPIFTFLFEILVILFWGFLCRRLILIPIDFVAGRVTRAVYFATQCGIDEYEFHKGRFFCEWKFYYGSNQTLYLLVPICATKEDLAKMSLPKQDEKIWITYFRFSKILLNWTPS